MTILQHPATGRLIEVADADADLWRQAGWLDPEDADGAPDEPTEAPEGATTTRGRTRK